MNAAARVSIRWAGNRVVSGTFVASAVSRFVGLVWALAVLCLPLHARAEDPTADQMIRALTPALDFRDGPSDVSATPANATLPLVINFEVNSAVIREDSKPLVRELGRALSSPDLRAFRFEIGGHTDSSGGYGKNVKLSFERAISVRNMLVVQLGIPSARLTARGYGPDRPIPTADSKSPLQRRVEIVNVGPAPIEAAASPADASAASDGRGTVHSDRLYGTVMKVMGHATIFSPSTPGGAAVASKAQIYEHDRIVTQAGAEVLISGLDGSRIAVRPESVIQISSAQIRGKSDDHVVLRLAVGSIRSITGWVTRINPASGYRIGTPVATIGVRGTDHEPFVIDAASSRSEKAGTYDKVNDGTVVMEAGGTELAIAPGKIGYAAAGGDAIVDRGLFSLLAPVLLDRAPDFYLPGPFEAELDAYSRRAEVSSLAQLAQRAASNAEEQSFRCDPPAVGRAWLSAFDDAQRRRDTHAIEALFDPGAELEVQQRAADGATRHTMRVPFAEFASRLEENLRRVTDLEQTRSAADIRARTRAGNATCTVIDVDSELTESGKLDGRAYEVRSREQFVLQRDGEGRWRATSGKTAPL